MSLAEVKSDWRINQDSVNRYRAACQHAAEDEKAFSRFRSNPDIAPIYENVSQKRGQAYLDESKKLGLKRKHLYMAHNIERLGFPSRFLYDGISLSPATLRYLFIAFDSIVNCDPFREVSNVVEVGGGYGGQASIFRMLWDVESYTIVDIPEALSLQMVYLNTLGAQVHFVNAEKTDPFLGDLEVKLYDLFISNYALDELTDEAIERYMVLIKRSKHGYITANAADKLESLLPKIVKCHLEPSNCAAGDHSPTIFTW